MSSDALVIRQLLAGRDFARADPIATQMVNFAYLVGSARSREAVLIDPAWDVGSLLACAEEDGFRVVGALASHDHPDHVGGDLFGHQVEGVAEFLARTGAPVYVHEREADGVRKLTGADTTDLRRVADGETLDLDGVRIEFLHTPGHTPGSQCFYVNRQALLSGDTLFVGGCGRVDLPGGDDEELYRSLNDRLGKLPGATVLYPGHDYGSVPSRTLREERQQNLALVAPTLEHWRRFLGRR